jgi:hypothetical protein
MNGLPARAKVGTAMQATAARVWFNALGLLAILVRTSNLG